MNALPETFDMVKRLGLFVWMAKESKKDIQFDELFKTYRLAQPALTNKLRIAELGVSKPDNLWAIKKAKIGLPNKNSRTSISKYVRVGHGLGFFQLEKKQSTMVIRQNWLTVALRRFATTQKNIFELTEAEKLLMCWQLLDTDNLIIFPLIKSMDRLPLSASRWISNDEFEIKFATSLLSQMEAYSNLGIISARTPNLLKRFKFIQQNLSLLEMGRAPTRGFLHMLEPRIHWLIDLALIDVPKFYSKGEIKPGDFCEEIKGEFKSMEDYNQRKLNLIKRYVHTLFSQKEKSRLTLEEAIPLSIESSIDTLKSMYPGMVPLDAMLRLSSVVSSVTVGKLVPENEIFKLLEKKYNIYRDWRSGPGFLELPR